MEANKAIGIQFHPDGGMKQQLQYLHKKIAKWCDAVRTKKIHKHEAWYCLNATILKTIEYPLVATTFTKEECKGLLHPIFKVILWKCGIQCNLPRKLVHGPTEARGLNIKDPYWMQLIAHLQSILRHSPRDSPSHDLHNDNMELLQFHIGSQCPFWDLPFAQYGCLAPEGWMKHTWKALD